MLSDASEHICEPGLGIHVVQAGGLDQGVEDSRTLTATAVVGGRDRPLNMFMGSRPMLLGSWPMLRRIRRSANNLPTSNMGRH